MTAGRRFNQTWRWPQQRPASGVSWCCPPAAAVPRRRTQRRQEGGDAPGHGGLLRGTGRLPGVEQTLSQARHPAPAGRAASRWSAISNYRLTRSRPALGAGHPLRRGPSTSTIRRRPQPAPPAAVDCQHIPVSHAEFDKMSRFRPQQAARGGDPVQQIDPHRPALRRGCSCLSIEFHR